MAAPSASSTCDIPLEDSVRAEQDSGGARLHGRQVAFLCSVVQLAARDHIYSGITSKPLRTYEGGSNQPTERRAPML